MRNLKARKKKRREKNPISEYRTQANHDTCNRWKSREIKKQKKEKKEKNQKKSPILEYRTMEERQKKKEKKEKSSWNKKTK